MRRDLISGVVLLGLAAAYYAVAQTIHRSQLSDVVGASSFPSLLGITLAVLSILLIVTGVLGRAPAAAGGEARADVKRGFLRAGGTLLIGAGFLAIIGSAGYILAVTLLMIVMVLYNSNEKRFAWPTIVIGSLGVAVFLWLMFQFMFGIDLPLGLWKHLFS